MRRRGELSSGLRPWFHLGGGGRRGATAILAAALFAVFGPALGAEGVDNPLERAFTNGTLSVDVRLRYEHVDQAGFSKDADATTSRARVGFVTDETLALSGRLEVEGIDSIGHQGFNSTTNAQTAFPVVADPDEIEINRLYLQYNAVPDTTLKAGRQWINLDNARFVGRVQFRQNEQTFDSLVGTYTGLPDTRLFYAYVRNVNRIFGDGSVNGNFRSDTHLFNASYSGLGFGKASAYAYLLDFTDPARANTSTATYGLRFTGKTAVAEGWNALYTAEFAHQTDWADSNVDNSHDYYLAEIGLGGIELASVLNLTAKVGYEVLDADGTRAFQTPLATLFAFNGWADRFLGGTPVTGLVDQYASIGAKAYGTKFLAVYHDFDAEEGNLDHGEEWDFLVARTFFEKLNLSLRYATYSADNTSVDTDKFWATAQVKF